MSLKSNNSLSDLQNSIGYSFKNTVLLNRALVHSSYVNENPALEPVSNERLEFLGDAVLGLIIAEKLYHDYPLYDEGQMTRIRAAIVCQDTLSEIARNIDLGKFLVMGKGEAASGGREKPANLSSALEALIAAVYLDQGLPAAETLVLRLFAKDIERGVARVSITDYKSKLQEILQSKYQQQPAYVLLTAEGPEHERKFTVEVRMLDKVLGKGSGRNKKAAEMEAAQQALETINK